MRVDPSKTKGEHVTNQDRIRDPIVDELEFKGASDNFATVYDITRLVESKMSA